MFNPIRIIFKRVINYAKYILKFLKFHAVWKSSGGKKIIKANYSCLGDSLVSLLNVSNENAFISHY